MRPKQRLTVVLAAVIGMILLIPGTALAGGKSGGSSGSSNQKTAQTAPGPVQPNLTPKGCNSGNFCSYINGNGGSLCFQTNKSVPAWPSGCMDNNDSAYNHSSHPVNLYYYTDYSDAYASLGAGNYWLYMSKNHFNKCSDGSGSCDGLGYEMQNNVESNKFF